MINIVGSLFQVFYWLLIARLLLSWIPIQSPSKTVREIIGVIYDITEVYLRPFRNLVPSIRTRNGYLDISPIIGLVVLNIIRNLVISFLRRGGF